MQSISSVVPCLERSMQILIRPGHYLLAEIVSHQLADIVPLPQILSPPPRLMLGPSVSIRPWSLNLWGGDHCQNSHPLSITEGGGVSNVGGGGGGGYAILQIMTEDKSNLHSMPFKITRPANLICVVHEYATFIITTLLV